MMLLVKRIALIAVIVLVVAVPLNDAVRYLGAFYTLDNTTREAAQAASQQAKRSPNDRRGPGGAAVLYAHERGVEVYGYDQAQSRVTVWTRMPVPGTLAWGPIVAAMAGKPIRVWWTTPPVIQSKAEAFAM